MEILRAGPLEEAVSFDRISSTPHTHSLSCTKQHSPPLQFVENCHTHSLIYISNQKNYFLFALSLCENQKSICPNFFVSEI